MSTRKQIKSGMYTHKVVKLIFVQTMAMIVQSSTSIKTATIARKQLGSGFTDITVTLFHANLKIKTI